MNIEINQLEEKMNYVQVLIDTQKLKLDEYQKILLTLAQQLAQIKQRQLENNMNKNNQNNALAGELNTK